MAEINAALGISQLKKIDKFIAARKIIAKKYIQAFKNMVNVKLIKQSNENVYHLFILKVNNREQFIKYMHDEGISCIVHYPPVYDHSYHNRGNVNCPYTASIYDQIVSIPMFYKLSEGEQNYIISKIIHWENSMNSIIKEMGI